MHVGKLFREGLGDLLRLGDTSCRIGGDGQGKRRKEEKREDSLDSMIK
jgi:hypothetical protein